MGKIHPPARFRRLLRTRRTLSAAVYIADDGDPGTGGWRAAIVVGSPRPATGDARGREHCLGVAEFYRVGGAHAIAALAYGTKSVKPRSPRSLVRAIEFVTTAKKLVSFDCAIDMLAGPTEAIVVADDGNPAFSPADLVAQAEHDPDTRVVFVTSVRRLAGQMADALSAKSRAKNN